MPTLQDVARAAGVSLATASRALQGGTCAAATRAKVRAAAEAVGWVPDPGLASQVSRRWTRRKMSRQHQRWTCLDLPLLTAYVRRSGVSHATWPTIGRQRMDGASAASPCD
jgi:hypothetical protein